MGPNNIKKDIYKVMTKSRELTNYCQESVKSLKSKKISDSLNNFHLKTSVDFITKTLNDRDSLFFGLNELNFDDPAKSKDKPIFNKVIDYIESYLIKYRS